MSWRTWTFERRLVAAALLAWSVVAIANLVAAPLFGHDEAIFAVIARDDVGPPLWLYRSRGVTMLAEIGVALGGADWQVRLPFAVLAIGLPLAVFAVGRAAFDARTGAWAAAVIATSHQLLARNAQVLGDVLAAAGVLAGIAIVTGELARAGGPRRRLAWAAPAFAAAFYVRYGSAPVIALAVLAAPLIWWPAVRARPGVVLATGALLGALLVPHVLHSLDATDSALGVLRLSAGVPRRAYLGEGLVTYVTANPVVYYGAAVAPVLLAGLAGLVRVLRGRATAYLAVVALGQVAIIGVQSHAQPRYVFLGVALLVVLGVATMRAVVAARPRLAHPRAALLVLALAWLGAVIVLGVQLDRIADRRASIVAAADAIRADGKRPCVVIADVIPQILRWYTGCFGYKRADVDEVALAPHNQRYLVSSAYGALDPRAFEAELAVRVVRELPTRDPRTRVWVVRGVAE